MTIREGEIGRDCREQGRGRRRDRREWGEEAETVGTWGGGDKDYGGEGQRLWGSGGLEGEAGRGSWKASRGSSVGGRGQEC